MWILNNKLLNNYWVRKEIMEEIERYIETNKSDVTTFQNLGDEAKALLRGSIYTIAGLPQEAREISNTVTGFYVSLH